MGVWNFIQDQVLGMKWLNSLIGAALSALGVDTAGRFGASSTAAGLLDGVRREGARLRLRLVQRAGGIRPRGAR